MQKRVGFKMQLNKGMINEYENRHNNLWPELQKLLKDAGISEYSIFFDEDTGALFAFQKQAGDRGSQDLGQTEIVKKWWKYMSDIMQVNPDNSPVTTMLKEVFYMD